MRLKLILDYVFIFFLILLALLFFLQGQRVEPAPISDLYTPHQYSVKGWSGGLRHIPSFSVISIIQELRYLRLSRSARARPLSRPGSPSWGRLTVKWPLISPGHAPCHWHSPNWHQCLTKRWEPDTGTNKYTVLQNISNQITNILLLLQDPVGVFFKQKLFCSARKSYLQ